MASTVNAVKSTLTNPNLLPDNSSEEMFLLSKPALSYVALIAKVLLASPSQKLNLASIYRAMEDQFLFLSRRGPGWRNSVRHNLSVNECFVKVSRCEDGRGHYWGVHRTYLRDFQRGDFRLHRKTRGRREREKEKERCDKVVRCRSWMEHFLGQFYDSRGEPQCPLQEPTRYQMCSWDWTRPHFQPLSLHAGWVQSARLRLPDSNSTATAVRRHDSQPMTSRPLRCWEMNDPTLTGMTESYDGRVMTPPARAFVLPGCWCFAPVVKELMKPLPHRIYF